jgi:hypothetical protein
MQTIRALRAGFRAPLFSIRDMILLCVTMPALVSVFVFTVLHP